MRDFSGKLSGILRQAENPARYTGGEYGITVKDAALKCVVCFPDLYEIGMSNQAVAILYGMLNGMDNISCERVFCPASDFEDLLKNSGILLYGLETGRPLASFDIAAFSIGYELSATNILTVLDRGGIPLKAEDRSRGDPIVIAGGPATTNPLPFGAIFDAIYIGEAEAEFRVIAEDLARMKKKGAPREDLLDRIRDSASFWYSGKISPARRSIWMGFPHTLSHALSGPVPSLRTVQDHGVVEIMRGCPHGCRFCHAGVYYKPFRMKNRETIYEEVYNLIHKCGYREITLSSLSSGDYTNISQFAASLNEKHSRDRVSFSLPSIHLESFGIEILEELSTVRKSGLTFAVETPRPEFQLSLNKQASRDKIILILKEARRNGWKLAKFYFMIGLPIYEDRAREAQDIIDFVYSVYSETRMNLNINIGTFVPKAHTPYQRAAQLRESEALESINRIKRGLQPVRIKPGYHAPFQSYLEGFFSRGGPQAGELLFDAWGRGARFDAWEDRSRPGIWRQVLNEAAWNVEDCVCRSRSPEEKLPWEKAVGLAHDAYLKNEWKLHTENRLTSPCAVPCPHPCGVCGEPVFPVIAPPKALEEFATVPQALGNMESNGIFRHICKYEKTRTAAFLPHLSLMQVMERGLLRAGIAIRFTEGFNPKPVLEFAQPSSVGVESLEEIFSFETYNKEADRDFVLSALNKNLPEGLLVKELVFIKYAVKGKKPPSLMSMSAGGRYELLIGSEELYDKLFAEFRQNESVKIIQQTKEKLVLDYFIMENGKGFQACLKTLINGSLSKVITRKLTAFARYKGKIMPYEAAVKEAEKEKDTK
jgi:radical SAM-linked protein